MAYGDLPQLWGFPQNVFLENHLCLGIGEVKFFSSSACKRCLGPPDAAVKMATKFVSQFSRHLGWKLRVFRVVEFWRSPFGRLSTDDDQTSYVDERHVVLMCTANRVTPAIGVGERGGVSKFIG